MKAGLDAKTAVLLDADGRSDHQPRLRAGRGGPGGHQPDPLPDLLPEKREFFLESSGLFTSARRSGLSCSTPGASASDTAGVPVTILGGIRMSGKAGPWAIGAIDARTGNGRGSQRPGSCGEARSPAARLPSGACWMHRSWPGLSLGAENAAGLDVDLPLVLGGRNVEPSFWIAGTQVPGIPGTPKAWRVATDYPNDLFDTFVSLYRIDAGLYPDPRLRTANRHLGDDRAHRLHAPSPGAGRAASSMAFPSRRAGTSSPTQSGSLPRQWRLAGQADVRNSAAPGGEIFRIGARFEANVLRLLDAPMTALRGLFRA